MKKKISLTFRTIKMMVLNLLTVFVAVTFMSYWHISTLMEEQIADELSLYMKERGQRESEIFLLAQDSQEILKEELKIRLLNQNPKAKELFWQRFETNADGVTQNINSTFDGTKQTGVFIGAKVNKDEFFMHKINSIYESLNSHGRIMLSRFVNTYINSKEDIVNLYWPSEPNYTRNMPVDYTSINEEYVYVADEIHNPQRKTVWTGLYYDNAAKVWMVSCETPLYIKDKLEAIIGHDIILKDLFNRTIENHLLGAYNIIFQKDGRLILHPELMDDIILGEGKLKIEDTQNEELKSIFSHLQSSDKLFSYDEKSKNYLGAIKIDGPDWYFVTVYPKSLIEDKAFNAAKILLYLGLIALILEIVLLFYILRTQIAKPLDVCINAIKDMKSGIFNVALNKKDYKLLTRQDEIGDLFSAFNEMGNRLQSSYKELSQFNETLEKKVQSATQELVESNEKLTELAHTDPLTKLYNRRYFFNLAQQICAIDKRKKRTLSILMMDIDHFKVFNDTYGHNFGDEVLKSIADELNKQTRESDILARVGGEEFALLLPETSLELAQKLAQKICKNIESTSIEHNGDRVACTISIGASQMKIDEEDIDSALKRADVALYRAKESGRNKVEIEI